MPALPPTLPKLALHHPKRLRKRSRFFVCAFFWLLCTALLLPPASAASREALHAEIDRLQLANTPAWRALLHRAPGNTTSAVVDAWFFLSPQGREDAAAELHATLDGLIDNPTIAAREEPAACVFAARHAYLQQALGAAFTALAAAPECPRRAAWLASLDAQQLWLVFPTGYLNSPSSMFGHTLLRIDSRESQARGPLLAYAANFVAETSESNGLVFAIKGLAGGYVGRYGVLPYYEKVREYVRLESRDVWEYPLKLDAADQQRLLLHLWELRGAGFTYYFFSRNCAYQLLALLQTVRPALDLLSRFDTWATPTDTIRVAQAAGLLGSPSFRPALATTLSDRAGQLTRAEREQAAALSHARLRPEALASAPLQTQARVLDVAHDLTYLRYQNGGDRDTLLATDRRLLAARAATGTPSNFAAVIPPTITPERGHATQRLLLGGLAQSGPNGLLLGYRPAYHDLLDAPGGYTSGSEINFGDTVLRLDASRNVVKLHRFELIDIVSLAPRDTLRRPVSWRVSVGARRELAQAAPLRGVLDAAPGLAWNDGAGFWFAYLPLSFESGSALSDGHDLRAGLELGRQWLITPQLRTLGRVQWQAGLTGAAREKREATLGLQWDLSHDLALRAEGLAEDFPEQDSSPRYGASLALQRYF